MNDPPLSPGPALSGIGTVFFDAVGTLLHPDPPAPVVYAEVGRRFGSLHDPATIPARFRAAFLRQEGVDRAAGLRTNEDREAARWREIVGEVLDDVADPEGCFRELYDHFARPTAWRADPEAAPVLADLARRGYRLGVASNFDRRLHAVLAGIPALARLAERVISSEAGWRKPAPEFFALLCERAGLPPEQVLLVGDDRGNDYDGARAAGLAAVLLDPAGRDRSAVRVTRLGELLAGGGRG